MSYKETLQQHNTDLQGLIDKANALPDTGGGSSGGSVEMITGTLRIDAPAAVDFTIYAVNENLEVSTTVLGAMTGGTFSVAKGTIFAIVPWSSSSGGSDCTTIFKNIGGAAYIATNDNFTLDYFG